MSSLHFGSGPVTLENGEDPEYSVVRVREGVNTPGTLLQVQRLRRAFVQLPAAVCIEQAAAQPARCRLPADVHLCLQCAAAITGVGVKIHEALIQACRLF